MWETFNKVLNKEEISTEDADAVNEFIMLQWLSCDKVGTQVAQILNVYYDDIPIKNQLQFIQNIMPAHIKYIKYLKTNKEKDEGIELLCQHYNIRENLAKEYLEFYDKDGLDELRKNYIVGGRGKNANNTVY